MKENIKNQGHDIKIMNLLINEENNPLDYVITNDNNNNNNNNNNKLLLTKINSNDMKFLYDELRNSEFFSYRVNFLNAFYDKCLYGLKGQCDDIDNSIYCKNNEDYLLPLFCAEYVQKVCGLVWTNKRARGRGLATELIRLLNITTVDSPMSNNNAINFWNKLQLDVIGEPEQNYYEKMLLIKNTYSK